MVSLVASHTFAHLRLIVVFVMSSNAGPPPSGPPSAIQRIRERLHASRSPSTGRDRDGAAVAGLQQPVAMGDDHNGEFSLNPDDGLSLSSGGGGSWSTTGSFTDIGRDGSSIARSLRRDAEVPGPRRPSDVHNTPLRSNPTNRDASTASLPSYSSTGVSAAASILTSSTTRFARGLGAVSQAMGISQLLQNPEYLDLLEDEEDPTDYIDDTIMRPARMGRSTPPSLSLRRNRRAAASAFLEPMESSPGGTVFSTPVQEVDGAAHESAGLIGDLGGLSVRGRPRSPEALPSPSAFEPNPVGARGSYPLLKLSAEDLPHICGGSIGGSGRFCTKPPGDCYVQIHRRRKADIKADTYYVDLSSTTTGGASLEASIPASIIEGNPTGAAHLSSFHNIQVWSALFSVLVSAFQEEPANPEGAAASAREFIQELGNLGAPTPKRPRFAKAVGEIDENGWSDFQRDYNDTIQDQFEKVEGAVQTMQARLTLQGVSLGQPGPTQEEPSAWSAVENLQTRAGVVEGAVLQTQTKMTELDRAQLPSRVAAAERSLQIVNENTRRTYGLAAAAQEAAVRATQRVDSLNITGLSGVEERLLTMEAQSNVTVGELGMISGELTEAILEVRERVDAMDALDRAFPTPGASQAQERLNDLLGRVRVLEQRVAGESSVTVGVETFDSRASLRAWLVLHAPQVAFYDLFFDVANLMSVVTHRAISQEEVTKQADRAARIKLRPSLMTIMAAAHSEVPSIWAGTRTDTTTTEHPFGAMATPDMWDRGDGQHGLVNTIKLALESKVPQLVQQIDNTLGNFPRARQVCSTLLADAHLQWKSLSAAITDMYQHILVQTYGSRAHTTDERLGVWKVVTTMLDQYTRAAAKARYCARSVTAETDPLEANLDMLWGVLQAHKAHAEYQEADYKNHPDVHPKVQLWIFKTKASRDELLAATSKVATLQTELSAAVREVAGLKLLVEQLNTRVGRLGNGGGGGGGGGGGRGGGGDGGGDGGGGGRRRRKKGGGGGGELAGGDDMDCEDGVCS